MAAIAVQAPWNFDNGGNEDKVKPFNALHEYFKAANVLGLLP